jgi:hypothetical protein
MMALPLEVQGLTRASAEQGKYKVSPTCNFSYSSSHIKKAKKEQLKLTLPFHLNQQAARPSRFLFLKSIRN